MRQSSFIALVTIGLLVSGLTWAGPPDAEDPPAESIEENVEETVEETMETDSYGSSTEPEEWTAETKTDDWTETAAEPEPVLTFEEAVAVCSTAEDLQTCIDQKTGQAEMPAEMPMDSEAPETDMEEVEESVPE